MNTELFYLVLTVILMVFLWIPFVMGLVKARGLLTPKDYRLHRHRPYFIGLIAPIKMRLKVLRLLCWWWQFSTYPVRLLLLVRRYFSLPVLLTRSLILAAFLSLWRGWLFLAFLRRLLAFWRAKHCAWECKFKGN